MDKLKEVMDIHSFLTTNPNVIWWLVVIGSVAVIGVVDFVKNWTHKKAAKWVVLVVSLIIAVILSPLTPPLVSTIIIMWLLILAVATIARNAIVDGLPSLVTKFIGSAKPPELEVKK
jgi:MFS superfamily sulfate permease-like transporter